MPNGGAYKLSAVTAVQRMQKLVSPGLSSTESVECLGRCHLGSRAYVHVRRIVPWAPLFACVVGYFLQMHHSPVSN